MTVYKLVHIREIPGRGLQTKTLLFDNEFSAVQTAKDYMANDGQLASWGQYNENAWRDYDATNRVLFVEPVTVNRFELLAPESRWRLEIR